MVFEVVTLETWEIVSLACDLGGGDRRRETVVGRGSIGAPNPNVRYNLFA